MISILTKSVRHCPRLLLNKYCFSTTSASLQQKLNSLHAFTEEEVMLKATVQKFAREQVQPLVSKMDENELLDPSILKALFDQGLMGIETPVEYGGSECSFTSAIVVVEGLLFLLT
jgi:alkylation response protein AidB-like acyl-CoA dehydrogenase